MLCGKCIVCGERLVVCKFKVPSRWKTFREYFLQLRLDGNWFFGFFSSSHLLTIYESQIRPSLKYYSHILGGATKSTLRLLDNVQSKAIRLINNPNLTKSLQPLSHRRLVGDLSIFYSFFNGYRSQEIRDIIPVSLRHVRSTRSSTHSHPFHVPLPNPLTLPHKSSVIPRTCNLWNVCLLLAFLNLTTCHLSHRKSINLI